MGMTAQQQAIADAVNAPRPASGQVLSDQGGGTFSGGSSSSGSSPSGGGEQLPAPPPILPSESNREYRVITAPSSQIDLNKLGGLAFTSTADTISVSLKPEMSDTEIFKESVTDFGSASKTMYYATGTSVTASPSQSSGMTQEQLYASKGFTPYSGGVYGLLEPDGKVLVAEEKYLNVPKPNVGPTRDSLSRPNVISAGSTGGAALLSKGQMLASNIQQEITGTIKRQDELGGAMLSKAIPEDRILPQIQIALNKASENNPSVSGALMPSKLTVGALSWGYETLRTKPVTFGVLVGSGMVSGAAFGLADTTLSSAVVIAGKSAVPLVRTAGGVLSVGSTAVKVGLVGAYGIGVGMELVSTRDDYSRGAVVGRELTTLTGFSAGYSAVAKAIPRALSVREELFPLKNFEATGETFGQRTIETKIDKNIRYVKVGVKQGYTDIVGRADNTKLITTITPKGEGFTFMESAVANRKYRSSILTDAVGNQKVSVYDVTAKPRLVDSFKVAALNAEPRIELTGKRERMLESFESQTPVRDVIVDVEKKTVGVRLRTEPVLKIGSRGETSITGRVLTESKAKKASAILTTSQSRLAVQGDYVTKYRIETKTRAEAETKRPPKTVVSVNNFPKLVSSHPARGLEFVIGKGNLKPKDTILIQKEGALIQRNPQQVQKTTNLFVKQTFTIKDKALLKPTASSVVSVKKQSDKLIDFKSMLQDKTKRSYTPKAKSAFQPTPSSNKVYGPEPKVDAINKQYKDLLESGRQSDSDVVRLKEAQEKYPLVEEVRGESKSTFKIGIEAGARVKTVDVVKYLPQAGKTIAGGFVVPASFQGGKGESLVGSSGLVGQKLEVRQGSAPAVARVTNSALTGVSTSIRPAIKADFKIDSASRVSSRTNTKLETAQFSIPAPAQAPITRTNMDLKIRTDTTQLKVERLKVTTDTPIDIINPIVPKKKIPLAPRGALPNFPSLFGRTNRVSGVIFAPKYVASVEAGIFNIRAKAGRGSRVAALSGLGLRPILRR